MSLSEDFMPIGDATIGVGDDVRVDGLAYEPITIAGSDGYGHQGLACFNQGIHPMGVRGAAHHPHLNALGNSQRNLHSQPNLVGSLICEELPTLIGEMLIRGQLFVPELSKLELGNTQLIAECLEWYGHVSRLSLRV